MRKILVVDDTELHLEAARAQFADRTLYELETAETYDEAAKKLCPGHPYDVVLIDLLMYWGKFDTWVGRRTENERFRLEHGPMGAYLALQATGGASEKLVIGLLTDMNHHAHPASACLDPMVDVPPWTVGGKVTVGAHNYKFVSVYRPEDLARPLGVREAQPNFYMFTTVLAKNWKAFLDYLDGKEP